MYDHQVALTKQSDHMFQNLAQWQVICKPIAALNSFKTVTACIAAQTACWVSYMQLTYATFINNTRWLFIQQLHQVNTTGDYDSVVSVL
jgi:hypothetical protein